MTRDAFWSLVRQTLFEPRDAARRILSERLPLEALWIALLLVSVTISLLLSGLSHLGAMSEEQFGQIIQRSPAYSAPLVFALIQWGRSIATVFVFFWIGRMMGGRGTLEHILAVLTWMQFMTFMIILGVLVVGVILPFAGSLIILIAFVWLIWVVIALLDEVNGFGSMLKAAGLLIVSQLGVTIGLSLFYEAVTGLFMRIS